MLRFRPRLRFSLRTLFVLVTALGAWLGYHLNWIRERREYLSINSITDDTVDTNDRSELPLGLRILGEQSHAVVFVMDEADVERIQRLFPEARAQPLP